MADRGWTVWDGRPPPQPDAAPDDAAGRGPRRGGDSDAYESEWYRSLRALAGRVDDPHDGEDARTDSGDASPPPSLESIHADSRRRALDDIGRGGLAAVDVQRVLAMTLDPDEGVRMRALAALRSQADLLPEADVRRALQDPVAEVRAEAVQLAAARGGKALAALAPLLRDRRSETTQAAALHAVARVAGTRPLTEEDLDEALFGVAALSSPLNDVERGPLAALATAIGERRLIGALAAQDDRRLGAARLLWLLGSAGALRALARLGHDPVQEIRATSSLAAARARELLDAATASATPGGSSPVERAAESEMLTALARALDDPDDRVRSRARAALLDVDRPAIVRWVRVSMQAGDDDAARVAAEAARLLGVEEVAPDLLARAAAAPKERREPYRRALSSLTLDTASLVDALARVAPERRAEAANLVWTVAGSAALPVLRRGVTNVDPSVRAAVLHVLADAHDVAATDMARRVLATDSSPDVRVATLGVLASSSPDDRLASLAVAMRDPDPAVRSAGVEALGAGVARQALGILRKALDDPDDRVRAAVLPHLCSLPLEEVPFLWTTLRDAAPEQRDALVATLRDVDGSPIADLAVAHAGSLDPREREVAVTLAGAGATDGCVEACIASLRDPVVAVRRAAASSLSILRRTSSVEALGASMQDPEPEVRIAALRALGVIDSERVLGFLVRALHDPSADVRSAASAVLTEWSSPAVARRLAGVLATPALREQATGLLTKMGPSAAELLVDVLLRSTGEMAPTVGGLLESIVGIEAFAARLGAADPQQRRRAVVAIAAIGGDRAVELALATLDDPDQHLRIAALEALADLGDVTAVSAVQRVADLDPVDEVADTARWVLGRLRAPERSGDDAAR